MARIEEDQSGMQRGQTRRIRQSVTIGESREDRFEAGTVGGGEAGVDMSLRVSVVFLVW